MYIAASLLLLEAYMQIRDALTFDDVLLEPAHSTVIPARVDTNTKLIVKLWNEYWIG